MGDQVGGMTERLRKGGVPRFHNSLLPFCPIGVIMVREEESR